MESYFFIICNDPEQVSSSFGTVIDGSNFDLSSYQMTGKDDDTRVYLDVYEELSRARHTRMSV